jgi:hypothetical protein
MWCSINDLHEFYLTPQGITVQTILSHKLHGLWPNLHGLTLGAYGYPLPYLPTFSQEASHTVVCMPGPLGATPWPVLEANKVLLCEENRIPLMDQCLDRLMLIHALEFTENSRMLLRESWRVLKNGGELLIMVPNRRGFWCRSSTTPLGQGQPYTGRQLFGVLCDNSFQPQKPTYALFHPPLVHSFPYRSFRRLEECGAKWVKKIGGMVIIQAQKSVLGGLIMPSSSWKQSIFIPQSSVSP